MKQFLLVALAIVTGLSSALGNLGDDSDRIENLYGNLVQRQLRDDGTVSVLYHKGRYVYLVIFANNRSISESYSHINGTDLSEKEIAKFLKLNAAGATWIPVDTSKERRFKRSDNRAEATYASTNGRRALAVRELRGKGAQGAE
ncbi:MAG TPA: hypothetical protein VFA61_09340 [Candidatus Udaeobacter sp.]|nr:hypothetical protein [Candidatus Udaeobacter sp.]